MGKIIPIVNHKGGVGKTTSAINLGAALAAMEKKVLIVDADPQGNASSGLGLDINDPKLITLYQCLTITADQKSKGSELNIDYSEAICDTDIDNLKIIPSNINLVGAELDFVNMDHRSFLLKSILDTVKDEFDYIFIDCAPSLGIITTNALVAADGVIIPVQCEYLAEEGLAKLYKTILDVKKKLNPKLEIFGILLTMFDSRTKLSVQVVEDVRNYFKAMVFNTLIHRNTRLSEAPSAGESIISYDADSRGAQDYMALAEEVDNRLLNWKK